jgi:uncharacterized protein YdhG (YjbR/CyaY superfamily)
VTQKFATVDDYIASFPPHVQEQLQAVRRAMSAAAPGAEETISYDIPTFKLAGRALIYFAGWKAHISVYPIPAVDPELDREIDRFKAGRGTLKFPLAEPIPYALIGRLTDAAVADRAGRARY